MAKNTRIALCALSLHLPQDQVTNFLDECRRRLASAAPVGLLEDDKSTAVISMPGRECWITLVVDEWDGLHDLARLATHVDVLSFSERRRGFGAARSTAVQEAQIAGARWTVIVDADGQHEAQALERVLVEVERSNWAAAIPQRTRIDLPLLDEGDLNRKLAERFESYFLARVCGRDDLTRLDMQPGLFLLGQSALELLVGMQSRSYSWDLEASHRLLTSGLEIGFPQVETRPQATSFFSTADSHGNLRFLADMGGVQSVRDMFGRFRMEPWVMEEFSTVQLDAHARHLEEALHDG